MIGKYLKDRKLRQIAIALHEIDIDACKIGKLRAFTLIFDEYHRGAWTREEFQNSCKNLNILNGGKLSPAHPNTMLA